MKKLLASALTLLLATGAILVADEAEKKEVKSGLAEGDQPPPFNVNDCTGPNKGKSLCYRCQYGARPVVSVFTRGTSEELGKMLKELDGLVEKNKEKEMKSFVVLLTDDPEKAEKELIEFAKEHEIKNIPLTYFDGEAGPPEYKIAKEAQMTINMWVKSEVKSNRVVAEKKLDKDTISTILKDTKKILE